MKIKTITIEATTNAPVNDVWKYWTEPTHIKNWSFATDEWHCPHAENDLRVGGKFTTRMEAKDDSFGFDFSGTYTEVKPNKLISYTMSDGRKVDTEFSEQGDTTKIEQTFDAETENAIEMQKNGWQAILNSFKNYTDHQK